MQFFHLKSKNIYISLIEEDCLPFSCMGNYNSLKPVMHKIIS